MYARDVRLALAATILIAIGAWACGGSSSTSNPTAPAPPPAGSGSSADVTITIAGMNGAQSFSPNPGSLKAGQKVAWRNADSVAHTATADGGAFNTGTIAPGAVSNAITLNSAGTFGYHCSIHPSMVGTLTVTP